MSVRTGKRADWFAHKGIAQGQPIRTGVGTQSRASLPSVATAGTQRGHRGMPMTGRVERGTQSPGLRMHAQGAWRDVVLAPLLADALDWLNRDVG